MATTSTDPRELGHRSLDWLLASAQETPDGLGWIGDPGHPGPDPTLYSGGAGIVLALLEGLHDTGDQRYADAALRGARAVAAAAPDWEHSSLYFGITGMAFVLHAVGERLDDDAARAGARGILDLVRSRFDGERWGPQFDLLGGNAGIALGALAAGDPDLAVMAVRPYLRRAEPTPNGVQWEIKTGTVPRLHHISHGTLGIVCALAATGYATGERDFVDLALAGARDVIARNEAGPDGFVVPHSDPQQQHERLERYAFGWCHGPSGDAQAFRLLATVTGDASWRALTDRCRYTVVGSGIPHRKRPGFWDNNGRCCGTAGVLAFASDRMVEHGDTVEFAETLAADLASRAIDDADGPCWSNHEYRTTPSDLPARTGWAMGNAGIARELLRYARVRDGRDSGYAAALPDHIATAAAVR